VRMIVQYTVQVTITVSSAIIAKMTTEGRSWGHAGVGAPFINIRAHVSVSACLGHCAPCAYYTLSGAPDSGAPAPTATLQLPFLSGPNTPFHKLHG